jgi:hypothetical protein
MFEEIGQGQPQQRSAGPWQHSGGDPSSLGFDFRADAAFDVDDTIAVAFELTIFTVPENITAAEVTGLSVILEPRTITLPRLAWGIVISGGGPQEYLVGSNQIVSGAGAPTVSVPTLADSGLRGIFLGSLNHPVPVRIRLRASQRFGVRAVSIGGGLTIRAMFLTRATGQFFR